MILINCETLIQHNIMEMLKSKNEILKKKAIFLNWPNLKITRKKASSHIIKNDAKMAKISH